jgi:hypothetical protein
MRQARPPEAGRAHVSARRRAHHHSTTSQHRIHSPVERLNREQRKIFDAEQRKLGLRQQRHRIVLRERRTRIGTPTRRQSPATREKIGVALKGRHRHLSAQTRQKIARALRGRHHMGHEESAATRRKVSAALKSYYRTHSHRRRHYRHRRGYHLNAAARSRISAGLKRYYATHPHRRGYHLSAATREKISASLRKYYESHPDAALHRRRSLSTDSDTEYRRLIYQLGLATNAPQVQDHRSRVRENNKKPHQAGWYNHPGTPRRGGKEMFL